MKGAPRGIPLGHRTYVTDTDAQKNRQGLGINRICGLFLCPGGRYAHWMSRPEIVTLEDLEYDKSSQGRGDAREEKLREGRVTRLWNMKLHIKPRRRHRFMP